jgi:hypothetical protein
MLELSARAEKQARSPMGAAARNASENEIVAAKIILTPFRVDFKSWRKWAQPLCIAMAF